MGARLASVAESDKATAFARSHAIRSGCARAALAPRTHSARVGMNRRVVTAGNVPRALQRRLKEAARRSARMCKHRIFRPDIVDDMTRLSVFVLTFGAA